MYAFLNGQFVPESEARVSVFDRGFLYGDGLFETIRVAQAGFVGWRRHLDRLARGVDSLGLRLPLEAARSETVALELVQRNELIEGVLRIQVTRGVGRRGYSPRSTGAPTLVMTTHPMERMAADPPRWRLRTAALRLKAADALGAAKTCNRLVNVLARAEAEANNADEALLLNTAGEVVAAASANVFWMELGQLHTPPQCAGALPGVTRALVIELAGRSGRCVQESCARRETLLAAQGVFLTLSSLGIIEVVALDGQPVGISPVTRELRRLYLADVYGRPNLH